MKKAAIISDCTNFRYSLTRVWDETKPQIGFIMLNPSTADHEKDDPTIKKCIAFSEKWGYGSIIVGNLFAFRATNPLDLFTSIDPIGPKNVEYLINIHDNVEKIICAWGNQWVLDRMKKKYPEYLPLKNFNTKLHFLELSVSGTPKHPLYLKGNLVPIKY